MPTKTELAEAHRRIDELTQALDEKHKRLLEHEKQTVKSNARAEEMEKALSKQEKQLDEALKTKARLERNLSRALGYIDRVLEAERPKTTHQAVGDVYQEVNNYQGPQMEEPPMDNDLPGLRRSW